MIDIRQTPQYAKYLSKIEWEVERVAEINYFIKKFPLIGSILKIQRPEEVGIKKIREITKKHRVFQVIVEPKNELDAKYLSSLGFKLTKAAYLPTKTLVLDLTKTEKRLLRGFKKDARYAIRKTKNLRTVEIKNVEKFRNEWKKSVGLRRYVPPLSHLTALKNSFKKNCAFLVCFNNSNYRSEIIGGAIFLMAEMAAYYWQAFTNKEGRRALAQYKIVWEGIAWAKKRGAKVFDFEGIYDERFPNKSWQGFTHFKKSFGGDEIEYPGAFTKLSLLRF